MMTKSVCGSAERRPTKKARYQNGSRTRDEPELFQDLLLASMKHECGSV